MKKSIVALIVAAFAVAAMAPALQAGGACCASKAANNAPAATSCPMAKAAGEAAMKAGCSVKTAANCPVKAEGCAVKSAKSAKRTAAKQLGRTDIKGAELLAQR